MTLHTFRKNEMVFSPNGTTKCLHKKNLLTAKYGQLQIHLSASVRYLPLESIVRTAKVFHSLWNSFRQGDS
jgi:hypothetical protein